jgi:hypothetical protein
MRDAGDELASVGAGDWSKQGAWRSRVINNDSGASIEDMARRAYDAGYFPEMGQATAEGAESYQRMTSDDIVGAIRDELSGRPRFAANAGDSARSAANGNRTARRDALEERLARDGIDLSKMDNATVNRMLVEADDDIARAMAQMDGDAPGQSLVDLLPGEVPSMQTLDYIKRGMDDVLNQSRNPITRRLELDGAGRAVESSVRSFRTALTDANPAYGEALQAGGDPIRLEEAFKQAPRLFGLGVNGRTFRTAIERMPQVDRQALTAGLADDLFTRAQNGRLRPRDLAQPVFREKITALMGSDQATTLLNRVNAEIAMAGTGNRMSPGSNSITAEALEAMAEQDRGVGLFSDLARNFENTPGFVTPLVKTAAQAVGAPIGGFFRGMQAPGGQGFRDEVGRLLLAAPEEDLIERLMRPQRRQGLFGRRASGRAVPAIAGLSGTVPAR